MQDWHQQWTSHVQARGERGARVTNAQGSGDLQQVCNEFMTIITTISLDFYHLKLPHLSISSLEHILQAWINPSHCIFEPLPFWPHCSLQCGVSPTEVWGGGPKALSYADSQTYSERLGHADKRTAWVNVGGARRTRASACVGMAVASRGDSSSRWNLIPFQCEDWGERLSCDL